MIEFIYSYPIHRQMSNDACFLVFFNELHDLNALISSFSITFSFCSCPISDDFVDLSFNRSFTIADIFDAILELTVAFVELIVFVCGIIE